jgi:cytochrome P450
LAKLVSCIQGRRQASLVISTAPAIWQVGLVQPPSFRTVIDLHIGPVVRFTPNAVSINTAAAFQDIYGSRKANVVKSDWYRTIQYAEKGTASTFTAINPKQHAQKRRLLSYAFSESALRDMEPQVIDHVQKWCNHLGKRATKGDWSEGRNMSTWADYLTFDVLSDLFLWEVIGGL